MSVSNHRKLRDMGYMYEKAVQALGGAKLQGAQGLDYGTWTPNGVRSVVIAQDAILVEYHPPYNKGKIAPTVLKISEVFGDVAQGARMKDPLRALEHKQFNTLEEIIVDARLGIDPTRHLAKNDDNNRLRHIAVVNWSDAMSKAFISRVPQLRATNASATLVNGLGLQVMATYAGPGAQRWAGQFVLNPRVYKSDVRGGALDRYFRSVAAEHGVLVEETAAGEAVAEMNPLEVANIKQNRQNVAADVANFERLEYLLSQVKLLSAAKGLNTNVDKEGVKDLHKRLIDVVKRKGGDVPGLRYYLTSYGEAEGVPSELVAAYEKLGYLGDDKKSRAKIDEAAGYFNFDKGVMDAVRQVYKSRVKRKLYVPDADRYVPTLENIDMFISLLCGGPFDYVKYSYELELLATSGDAEILEEVISTVESVKRGEVEGRSTASKDVARDIASNVKGGAQTNTAFLVAVKKGSVDAGKMAYSSVSGIAWDAIQEGFEPAKNLVVAGLKIFIGRQTPWGAVAAPLLDKLADTATPALIEGLNAVFDELDKAVEGARGDGDEELDPALESALDEVFEGYLFWSEGIDLLDKFLNSAVSFSSLKKRQITRIARSKSGIKGLSAYLKQRKDQLGGQSGVDQAVEFFKRWGYIGTVEGQGDSVNMAKNILLTPEVFYEKVFKQFNSLSKMAEGRDKKQREGLEGMDQLQELDSMCRDVIGLPTRQYNGYSARISSDVGRSANIGERMQGMSSADVGF